MSQFYLLPSHPSLKSADPLGTCEVDDPSVWDVFQASVATFRAHTFSLTHLPNLVEDLAYSLHNDGKADAGFLRRFIKDYYPDITDPNRRLILEEILLSADNLPILFPTHIIPYLAPHSRYLHFTRAQVKCLVAHQLLGTLKPPPNNTWGCNLLMWYRNHLPLKHALRGYISTVFHYFKTTTAISTPVRYEFFTVPPPRPDDMPIVMANETPVLIHLEIKAVNTLSDIFPPPGIKTIMISSNTSPGFGSACTQEELITGACPELLPLGALCVLPPVPADGALLAQGVIPMTAWKGQRREARRTQFLETKDEYTFLLLDASELDMETVSSTPLPDLDLKYLMRDLHKAYTGFSALRDKGITEIYSPLWGTSAFGGDPVIKTLVLAMAGALTGVTVRLSVDEVREYELREIDEGLTRESKNLLRVLRAMKESCSAMSLETAWSFLTSDAVRACDTGWDVALLLISAGR